MKRSTRNFEIADPFYAALETMSRELEVDRDTLVNQAIFALARTFGFVTPSTVVLNDVAGAATVPPPLAIAPMPVMQAVTPMPAAEPSPLGAPPIATAAMTGPEATTMGPAPTSAVPVTALKPKTDLAAARAAEAARMAEIAKDMDALAAAAAKHAVSQHQEDEEDEEEPNDDEQSDSDDSSPGLGPLRLEEGADRGGVRDLDSTSDEHTPSRSGGDDEDENTDANARRAAAHDQEDDQEEPDAPAKTGLLKAASQTEPVVDRTVLVRPSATLKVWVAAADGNELQVEPGRFVIGRGDNCNLEIDSLRVSREHASIQIVGKEVIIEDLGSSNGTWFNGEKIERRLVTDGDEVVLGNERVRFRIES